MTRTPSSRTATPIAITGVSTLFPGARDVEAYWRNIFHGRDLITDVPETHWRLDDYFDADPSEPDKTYATRAGFVPETPFSPIEFGLPPSQLDVTDVLQLLSLSVARDLIADAGFSRKEMPKERTGAIFGITGANSLTQPLSNRLQGPVWRKVLESRGFTDAEIADLVETMKKAYAPWEENSFPGMLGNVVAGRVANRFDLGGTNCTIDAACASSLAAMRMAIDELQSGRADMMLTGGCDAENTILMFMCFSKTPAFSRKGSITPFDAEADGTLIGEGIGMMMLKRLEDATRDGDRVYAVIRGLGSSSDGRFKSIYAPRAEGQVRALKRAYEEAGVSPARIGLIEAHGTGTAVGDATEARGLRLLFEETGTLTDDKRTALGSVKSQIGHTKAAAGAASAIKAALALHRKVLPPTINVTRPDPKLGLAETPLYVNTETRPWFAPTGEKRVAGVSSFGFGGTNYHLVLEEAGTDDREDARFDTTPRPVMVAAATPGELATRCRELVEAAGADAWPFETDAPAEHARIAFAAHEDAERAEKFALAAGLVEKAGGGASARHPEGVTYRRRAMGGKIAALFSGQGSQHPGMGRTAMAALPAMRRMVERLDPLFVELGDEPLSRVMYPAPVFTPAEEQAQAKAIRRTRYAQAAIGALSAGQFALLREAGFLCDMAAGHSFGELTALWAAGAMDEDAFARLAKLRGEAMTPPEVQGFDPGTMTAVAADEGRVAALIAESNAEVQICNVNTPSQTVVGGSKFAISSFEKFLDGKKTAYTRLPVAGAFHTPRVAHAITAFSKVVDAVRLVEPAAPVYANRDGAPYGASVAAQLKAQLSEPVRFLAMVERMYADGARIFVEFGAKDALSRMVGRILGDRPHVAIALDRGDPAAALSRAVEACAELAAAGAHLGDPVAGRPPVAEPVESKKGTVMLTGVNHVSAARRAAWEEALANPPERTERTGSAPAALEPHIDPEVLTAEMTRKLDAAYRSFVEEKRGEIARLITGADLSAPESEPSAPSEPEPEVVAPIPSNGAVEALLVSIVAEKTGYPEDVLELDMDMEADLGIDSIKRVEILGALREESPSMAEPDPEALGSLRTLRDVAALAGAVVAGGAPAADPPPVAIVPEPEVVAPIPSNGAVEALLVSIVAEKTGYPEDVLELDMDMEADLGIDSIKRVEILGALREESPSMAEPDPEALGSLRTLRDVAALAGAVVAGGAPAADPPPVAIVPEPEPEPEPEVVAPIPSNGAVEALLVSIVAEKTGYPEDVLELDMDMEADLGIDSIKRVEILGALREESPSMAEPDPEALGSLRTLRDVAALAGAVVAGGAPAADPPPVAIVPEPEPEPEVVAPIPSNGAVEALLVSIVAEKTGYPEDVLELDMDMEADLGIDSIKRVEILGALREESPGMAEPDPEALGSLRTLRDVAALAGAVVAGGEADDLPGKSSGAPDPGPSAEPAAEEGIGRAVLRLVPAPAPLVGGARPERLLLCGDAALAGALARRLATQGYDPEICADLSEARARLAGGATPDGVILLRPAMDEGLPVGADDPRAMFAVESLILAGAAKKALAPKGHDALFMAVTRMDGALGYGETTADATAGALGGLLKTFAAESPAMRCRHVDIAPSLDADRAAALLLTEIGDADRATREVSIGVDGSRTCPEIVRASSALRTVPADIGTLVVTGGARGVTALCVKELARRAPVRLLLVGRSPLEDEPDWAKGVEGDAALKKAAAAHLAASGKPTPRAIAALARTVTAGREIRALLAELRESGARAEYAAADLADPAALRALATHPMLAGGKPLGIIHGAGALADAMLERKTEAEAQRVFAPKLYGLAGLIEALGADRIARLWLFSSVAGLFGNIGQSDYAMANETLNRVAAHWRRRGVDARALNWGAWDAGMVDDAVRAIFEERGVSLIPAARGAALFAEEFGHAAPETGLCMIGDLKPLAAGAAPAALLETPHDALADWTRPFASPLIDDHRIQGRAILPATFALGLVCDGIERLLPEWQVAGAERFAILNGIHVGSGRPNRFRLSLTPEAEAGDGQRLSAKVADESGRPRFALISARIAEAGHASGRGDLPAPVDAVRERADGFYDQGVLFHGPRLRLLADYAANEARDALSFGIASPEARAPAEGALFEPVLADAALQAMLAATFLRSGLPSLPAELRDLGFFGKPKGGAPLSVDLAFVSETAAESVWRMVVREGGAPLLAMTAKAIKSAALARRFSISAE